MTLDVVRSVHRIPNFDCEDPLSNPLSLSLSLSLCLCVSLSLSFHVFSVLAAVSGLLASAMVLGTGGPNLHWTKRAPMNTIRFSVLFKLLLPQANYYYQKPVRGE